MNKTSKTNSASAPGAANAAFHPLLGVKKAPPLLAPATKSPRSEVAEKNAAEAAERDKKLDLVLHRFAKLL